MRGKVSGFNRFSLPIEDNPAGVRGKEPLVELVPQGVQDNPAGVRGKVESVRALVHEREDNPAGVRGKEQMGHFVLSAP